MKSTFILFLFCYTSSLLASRAGDPRPNILFAIADDWSFGHAGAYHCPWVSTPAFDRVAREGLLFQHAYTPNAKCAPSRATLLTGRYSWQLEAAGNHVCVFPPKFGGFMERLEAEGYTSGYTGKGWGPGIALDKQGHRRAITGKNFDRRKHPPMTSGISPNDYAGNFEDFLKTVPGDQPWVFWYGTTEPHRGYEFKSGVRLGKRLDQIDRVPAYWPDNETSRHDMLDYAIEVEHYDTHLDRILKQLDAGGLAENTLVVSTSDHGMPFPRVKGQAYLHSNHVPLAIRWPAGIPHANRVIEDFVNFTDLAPTFLQAAGIGDPGPIMQPISGRSLWDIFQSERAGQVDPGRNRVILGKERHDIGRPNDWGYPIRGILTRQWLYLRNFKPDRWPAGNPETGYLNCDGSPMKTQILEMRRRGENQTWWQMSFGKRPGQELYRVSTDEDCVKNLAQGSLHAQTRKHLHDLMIQDLMRQEDPRMSGNGSVFDQYPYQDSRTAHFFERFMSGEKIRAGWVHPDDFEPASLD
jgi:N-sulfoglucosamine sulfohydrolase